MSSNTFINEYIPISESEMALRCGGSLVLFDTEDYPMISQRQWSIGNHGYAVSGAGKNQILMHRMVMSAKESEQIDHINQIKIDNRKCNLRPCSASQNANNRYALSNNRTGHKGVCQLPNGRYQVQLVSAGKPLYFGTYESLEEAVHISESAQLAIAGDFAAISRDNDNLDKDVLNTLALISHRKRMTSNQRKQVIDLHHTGMSAKDIAKQLGFSTSAIYRLLNGRTYKNNGGRNNARDTY